jgi:hypothetical protein
MPAITPPFSLPWSLNTFFCEECAGNPCKLGMNFPYKFLTSYFSNPSPFLDCWGFGVDAICTIGRCSLYVSSNRLQPHYIEEHRGASLQLHQRLCDPQVLYLMSSSTGIQTMTIIMKQELASM